MKPISSTICDVLILGGGAAGLSAAEAATGPGARVILADAGTVGKSGSTFFPSAPTRGFQVAWTEVERSELRDETIVSAQAEINPEFAEVLSEEIAGRIEHLRGLGVPFVEEDGAPVRQRGCFSEAERAVQIRDIQAFGERWRTQVESMGVQILDHHFAARLLEQNDRVAGALLLGPDGIVTAFAGATILTCGGGAGLYSHTLAPPNQVASGIGLAAPFDVGTANLPFIQFMPGTVSPRAGHFLPAYHLDRSGVRLGNSQGQSLLEGWIPTERREEIRSLRAGHIPFSISDDGGWIDIAAEETWHEGHPATWSDSEFDVKAIEADEWQWTPFAHSFSGGVAIDLNGRTSARGLWAAGEASGGPHGADRLGGNMLSSCLVFGHRAGKDAAANAASPEPVSVEVKDVKLKPEEANVLAEEIQSIVDRSCRVIRNAIQLRGAEEQLKQIRERLPENIRFSADTSTVRVWQRWVAANALVLACLNRPESKGSHYRSDDPLCPKPPRN